MGSIGGEVLEGIQTSIGLAEEKYKGVVIANEGQNFFRGRECRNDLYVCDRTGI
jgi:3-hydroxyacyl-CoA dehydrogenase